MTPTSMARDQYGQYYHDLGPHPRKTLLEKLGRKRVARMYVDTKDGKVKHVGWVIASLWLSVYYVQPMRKDA